MDKYIKKTGSILLVMALFLSYFSCEAMFTRNIFDSMDNLDLSSMSTAEQASAILDDADGSLASLTDDEVDELLDDLEDLYSDESEDDSIRMQAAAAAADVELTNSGSDDTINNISDMVSDLISDDLTVDDPGDILTSIFSDESGAVLSVEEITEQLESMMEAIDALEAYGSVLGDDGDVPEGVDSTELAVTALVVGLVDIMITDDGTTTVSDIAEAISTDTTDTLTMPSLDDLSADDGMDGLFGEDLANTIEGSSLVSSMLDLM
jgi:hypothetical protein